jgi:GR25 family glycosyltransferase involved in LPS biosynthesis
MNARQARRARLLTLIVIVIVVIIIVWLAWWSYGQRIVRHVAHDEHSPSVVTATCLGTKGQLGNQLFQAAAAIGVAYSNKCDAILPEGARETSLGKLCEFRGVRIGNVRPHATIGERDGARFTPIHVPADGRTYDLDGYFQSHLYTERCAKEVRSALRPRQQLIDIAVRKVPACASKHAIGLHVRRGDYMQKEYVDEFTHCTPKYYQDAVELIRARHGSDAIVVVCSDDLPWCKQHLPPVVAEPLIFAETGSLHEDFCVLFRCEHAVIANSSFSWWAAYLKPDDEQIDVVIGDGSSKQPVRSATSRARVRTHDIVAPYPWYQKTGRRAHLNSDDIYHPSWTIIDAKGTAPYVPRNVRDFARLAADRVDDPSSPSKGRADACERQRQLYGEVYVISLANERDRWASAREVLGRAGLVPHRLKAIDSGAIEHLGGLSGLKKLGLLAQESKLVKANEIGCGLSHVSLWARMLERGDEKVTVFEDDATSYVGQEELDRRVGDAMVAMDADWDVLYLGKCLDRCQLYTRVIDGLYRTRRPFCLHAYVMSARCARKMLARPLLEPVDTQLMHAIQDGYVKAYALHPSVFVQDIVRWSSTMRSFGMQVANQNDCEYLDKQ